MRICSKCGYEDPVCWHSYRWVTDLDFTTLPDFKLEYPQFADMKIGEIREDDHCYYRRSGPRNNGRFVFRWMKILGRDYYKSRFFERFKPQRGFSLHPEQTRLEFEG